jgi:hypothetical protein
MEIKDNFAWSNPGLLIGMSPSVSFIQNVNIHDNKVISIDNL